MVLPVFQKAYGAADSTTRAFVVRAVTVTVCLGFLCSLGSVLALVVMGRPVSGFLFGLLTMFGGGGISQLGSHTGSGSAITGVQAAAQIIPAVPAGKPPLPAVEPFTTDV